MNSKITALILLAVGYVAFSVSSSAKGVSSTNQQFRGGILRDGPGPMCFPSAGCGRQSNFVSSQLHSSHTVLLTDGGGPMCFPSTGCGYRSNDVLYLEKGPAAPLLLSDGGGPMCFPSTGCGRIAEIKS